jgi:hypothetical protein
VLPQKKALCNFFAPNILINNVCWATLLANGLWTCLQAASANFKVLSCVRRPEFHNVFIIMSVRFTRISSLAHKGCASHMFSKGFVTRILLSSLFNRSKARIQQCNPRVDRQTELHRFPCSLQNVEQSHIPLAWHPSVRDKIDWRVQCCELCQWNSIGVCFKIVLVCSYRL